MKKGLKQITALLLIIIMTAVNIPMVVFAENIDDIRPSISISAPSSSSVIVGESISYTVNFNDNIGITSVPFNNSHVVLNGFTGALAISGSGNSRKITITNIQGLVGHGKSIYIKSGAARDAAGNQTLQTPNTIAFSIVENVYVDSQRPSASISAPNSTSRRIGESISYTVSFNDNVGINSISMNSSHVVLNGFTGNVIISGTGNSRAVTIQNIQGSVGSGKSIYIKAGAARDAAGNQTLQTPNSISFTIVEDKYIDDVRPSISISSPNNTSIRAGESISYTVSFNDNIGITSVPMNSSHVVLNGFTGNVIISGTGNSRTVNITNIRGAVGPGKTIYIKAGAARDAAGNQTLQTPNTIAFSIVEDKYIDNIRPLISMSVPNNSSIYTGDSISYTVSFNDNVGITSIFMNSSHVVLNGFAGNVIISGTGNARLVTITNIRGAVGSGKSIYIKAGAARDAAGNQTLQTPNAIAFKIIARPIITPPLKPAIIQPLKPIKPAPQTKPNIFCIEGYASQNCSDFIGKMGDINKEITYMSSWLRAEKHTSQNIQENNYVSKDETMTYMIEYYNGSKASIPAVDFEITVPEAVVVEEINGKGTVISRTDSETKIKWAVGKLGHGATCRLYVRVRFTGNASLENSQDISKVFYVQLKTIVAGNTSHSYMKQLYVDKNPNKTGTFKKYLTSLEGKNEIRPDDQITRAEFARLLVDAGIIEVKPGSSEYKTFTDNAKIPENARDAISALVAADIIQGYADGEFKPGNPILRDDLMQVVAQASRYMSGAKLTIAKPTFIYTEALKRENEELSIAKDYIMELIRQNIISKTDIRPDDYAKRKEVVEIINNLTFRGPFVEKLPSDIFKYSDIKSDSKYFYNMVSATNTYTYKYDDRLWQETIKVIN